RVATLLKSKSSTPEIIADLYFATLSRPPREAELEQCVQIVDSAPNRKEGVEDILWALFNSREFLFHH
ncbi:MAG: hypothetical protein KDA79_16360, partial [Planctomycetaceae bacterium]|nr:hypothetical protein [Planctomycetaceae bacterium]